MNKNQHVLQQKKFNPYQASTTFKKCRICRSVVHQAGSHYCQGCAYKKGICAMCGSNEYFAPSRLPAYPPAAVID
uniref:Cysteine-rich PDZ-binding protein n=1 Tax=Romanomermis culicivorax TaxID=13658 RepID=A0A915HZZ3_ROMCU